MLTQFSKLPLKYSLYFSTICIAICIAISLLCIPLDGWGANAEYPKGGQAVRVESGITFIGKIRWQK